MYYDLTKFQTMDVETPIYRVSPAMAGVRTCHPLNPYIYSLY
jgi:hypothetical protein